jgi:hypothetical protein
MDGDRFKATFWGTVPLGPGMDEGSVKIRVRGHLSGGKLVGTFTVTGYDASGKQMFTATGTFTGTRIAP